MVAAAHRLALPQLRLHGRDQLLGELVLRVTVVGLDKSSIRQLLRVLNTACRVVCVLVNAIATRCLGQGYVEISIHVDSATVL